MCVIIAKGKIGVDDTDMLNLLFVCNEKHFENNTYVNIKKSIYFVF